MDRNGRLDGIAFVGVIFFAFMLLNVFKDQGFIKLGSTEKRPAAANSEPAISAETGQAEGIGGIIPQQVELQQPVHEDSNVIIAPYEHYAVTQGVHGADYGHMAIDISAGKGATIRSPINGTVTNLYIDEWGNPSLVLENERFLIELLHGIYTVQMGDLVKIGQPIGQESNQGNTADPWGYSCRNRDCGYHTHINVFDKTLGSNVNPLELFPPQ